MRIILAERRYGELRQEHTFDAKIVKVGRDPRDCQLVYDQAEWPMVSRLHAEFRWDHERLLLADLNSRFGTFLDMRRITEPAEVKSGTVIQFGTDGPVIQVLNIEREQQIRMASPAGANVQPGEAQKRVSSQDTLVEHRVSPRPANQQPSIEFITGAPGRKYEPLVLEKDVIFFGRDLDLDVVFDDAASFVSRRHASIELQEGKYTLVDLGGFNGTLLNHRRITKPVPLLDGDLIQLGRGGPLLRFSDPANPRSSTPAPGQDTVVERIGVGAAPVIPTPPASGSPLPKTVVFSPFSMGPRADSGPLQSRLLLQRFFDGGSQLSIGRDPDNEITLDSLQISKHHARLLKAPDGIRIEDLGSTNGVYLNGARITSVRNLDNDALVQIGPFVLRAQADRGVAIFDTRSETRIDAVNINKVVPNRAGGAAIKLLDDIDLTIKPNEFVGLLGPSGAGKTTLMDALNGMRRASSGQVLVNNLDLYQHLDSLKQSIGYVPQEDIIHRELTVYRTLYYVARLRLSRDITRQEIDQIVNEVLDVTGLSERREVPVAQLSGGQRKRVSIAVELITKPSIIFLDEPTSGLDPATEGRIMNLFRQLSASGRTIILTTHAVYNVNLFDKLVLLMRGKLVFYGSPEEALAHFEAENFDDIYERLEAPLKERLAGRGRVPADASHDQKQAYKLEMERATEEVAEAWKQQFLRTEQYRRNIAEPSGELEPHKKQDKAANQRHTIADAFRQWLTLSRRYMEVLSRDKLNLLILLGQSPLLAVVIYLVALAGWESMQDFPYFMLGLIPIWFGNSVAAREIIRERAVYKRERMVNLRLLPYVGSKLLVLSIIVGLQCVLMFATITALKFGGLMKLPNWGLSQLLVMILSGAVGLALGLFISAIVKSSEMATSLVPLFLIPQVVFSGIAFMPTGPSKVIGAVMPVTWSFDEMKRLSKLDTWREEGSDPNGPNEGLGLREHLKRVNNSRIQSAQQEIEKYKQETEADLKNYEKKIKDYLQRARTNPGLKAPVPPEPRVPPEPLKPEDVPEDLSGYLLFLHPWGSERLNPVVLLLMFFTLLGAIVVVLRSQDVR
jgi:ABC transport system ATP-binding/permease protein